MKDLVEKIDVNQTKLKDSVKWLAESKDNILGTWSTDIIRYLLKENEINKARIDILVQEVHELKNK
jgi:hypothetical protein